MEAGWWASPPTLGARLLRPLSLLTWLWWHLRRLPWHIGWRRAIPAGVPVLVVGNLIVGGAGKTPTVIALVEGLRRRGWTPGIVSRGYRASRREGGPVHPDDSAEAVGDEPLLMRRRTGATVWIGRDRPAALKALLESHPDVDVVISDDGRQHLALHRDAECLVIDERGVGNGWMLPAGPLREPMPSTVNPGTLVLYNAAQPTTALPGHTAQRRLGTVLPWEDWWHGSREAGLSTEALRSSHWLAVAGIGHPERFFAMLEAEGLRIERVPLPDHAPLDPRPWPADGRPVILTEKDAIKIRPDAHDRSRIHVATLDFSLPEEALDALHRCLVGRNDIARIPSTPEAR